MLKSVHIKIAMEFGADESPLDTAVNLGRNVILSRPMKDRTVPHEPYTRTVVAVVSVLDDKAVKKLETLIRIKWHHGNQLYYAHCNLSQPAK